MLTLFTIQTSYEFAPYFLSFGYCSSERSAHLHLKHSYEYPFSLGLVEESKTFG